MDLLIGTHHLRRFDGELDQNSLPPFLARCPFWYLAHTGSVSDHLRAVIHTRAILFPCGGRHPDGLALDVAQGDVPGCRDVGQTRSAWDNRLMAN